MKFKQMRKAEEVDWNGDHTCYPVGAVRGCVSEDLQQKLLEFLRSD